MPRHPRSPHSLPKSPPSSAKPLQPRTHPNPFTITQRLKQGSPTITPQEVKVLQRTLGNAAVTRLFQQGMQKHQSPAATTTPPIQRIEDEEAAKSIIDWFGNDLLNLIWKIIEPRLKSANMTLKDFTSLTFWGFMDKLQLDLLKSFEEWNKKPFDPSDANSKTQFITFLTSLVKDTPQSSIYLKQIVGQKDFTLPGDYQENFDEDFADDEGEYSDDHESRKEYFEGDDPPDLTMEQEVKVQETGKNEAEWNRRKSGAIDAITVSDKDAYDVTSIDDLLKGRKGVKAEPEKRQMKKKGNSTFVMRPKNAGDATIVLEKFTDPYTHQDAERTIFIEAEVIPTTTTGRLAAPEPESGLRVGTSKDVKTRKGASATDAYRNQGFVDAQKGHIIALELGGPDVPKNIVPQWANWQANGIWRKMETHVLAMAKQHGNLKMRVQVHYKEANDNSIATFNALGFPTHFTVTVWETAAKGGQKSSGFFYEKKIETGQDHTDDKLMFRQDDSLMKRMGQPSPYDPNELKSGSGNARKKTATKSPAKKKKAVAKKEDTSDKKRRGAKKAATGGRNVKKSSSRRTLDSDSSSSESEVETKKKKAPAKRTPVKRTPARNRKAHYSSSSSSSSSVSESSESEVETKKKKTPAAKQKAPPPRKVTGKRRRDTSSDSSSEDMKSTTKRHKANSTTKQDDSSDEDMQPTVRRSNRLRTKSTHT